MTNPTWPGKITPIASEWRLRKLGNQFSSPYTGSVQSVLFPSDRWEVVLELRGEGMVPRRSGETMSFLSWLAGGVNVVEIPYWPRPVPRGTMRGTVTLKVVTVRGDTSLTLNVSAGATLEPGDMLGISGQFFMVRERCVESGLQLVVPLTNKVRGVIQELTPVIWNRPLLPVIMPEMSFGMSFVPGGALPSQVTLVEP